MIAYGLVLLLLVSIAPCNSLRCYECGCDASDLSACNCDYSTDTSYDDYCIIVESRYTAAETFIQLSRTNRNSTWVYVEDPYYIVTIESIRYNRTIQQWSTWTDGIIFGCDWDLCNSPDLIDALPDSFQLTIPKAWLDTNIFGTGSVTGCHHCPTEVCGNTTNPIDYTQCPMTPCVNSTTVI